MPVVGLLQGTSNQIKIKKIITKNQIKFIFILRLLSNSLSDFVGGVSVSYSKCLKPLACSKFSEGHISVGSVTCNQMR